MRKFVDNALPGPRLRAVPYNPFRVLPLYEPDNLPEALDELRRQDARVLELMSDLEHVAMWRSLFFLAALPTFASVVAGVARLLHLVR